MRWPELVEGQEDAAMKRVRFCEGQVYAEMECWNAEECRSHRRTSSSVDMVVMAQVQSSILAVFRVSMI